MQKKILIIGKEIYQNSVEGLGTIVFDKDDFFLHPTNFQMVLFTGGLDLNPQIYNDTGPKDICKMDLSRDQEEIAIFDFAQKHKIKIGGICRGAQLLTALSGGRLMHHLDGHQLSGTHGFWAIKDGNKKIIQVSSRHHQMCIPGKEGYAIGWSSQNLSKIYIGKNDEAEIWSGPEIEAVYYPKTQSFGVQYHPETMETESDGHRWFHQAVEDFLNLSSAEFSKHYNFASTLQTRK